MTAPKSLEALIRERSPEEVAQLRKIAAKEQERAMLSVRFAMLVEHYRTQSPASVAPHWGIA
jgi:hypothetical protein